MTAAERRRPLASALQAAPSLSTGIEAQVLWGHQMPPPTAVRDTLASDFSQIGIGEVDDRRTISRKHAPATNLESPLFPRTLQPRPLRRPRLFEDEQLPLPILADFHLPIEQFSDACALQRARSESLSVKFRLARNSAALCGITFIVSPKTRRSSRDARKTNSALSCGIQVNNRHRDLNPTRRAGRIQCWIRS
jgi:hypothetical protein